MRTPLSSPLFDPPHTSYYFLSINLPCDWSRASQRRAKRAAPVAPIGPTGTTYSETSILYLLKAHEKNRRTEIFRMRTYYAYFSEKNESILEIDQLMAINH